MTDRVTRGNLVGLGVSRLRRPRAVASGTSEVSNARAPAHQ
jgi:hypothetical protein